MQALLSTRLACGPRHFLTEENGFIDTDTQESQHAPGHVAKCNSAHGNAKPANINDSVISKCSLCNRTETGFEQYNIPMSRTDHCTPENDNADDKARHATPTAEMHRTSTASHAKLTIAEKLRIKRGSHPAARRQRKRIAAARAAAAASESPPRLEETKSEQYNLPSVFDTRRSLDHYRTSLLP